MSFKEIVEQAAMVAAFKAAPSECQHERTEIRARTIAGGSVQHIRQCLMCGESVGNPVRKDGYAKPFDMELQASYRERVAQVREAAKAREREQWWGDYKTYMNSDEWRELRKRVLERDGHLCQGCLKNKASEVHHMSYRNFTREFAFELVSLCHACHERFHADDE